MRPGQLVDNLSLMAFEMEARNSLREFDSIVAEWRAVGAGWQFGKSNAGKGDSE